jgi:hypothetical protein
MLPSHIGRWGMLVLVYRSNTYNPHTLHNINTQHPRTQIANTALFIAQTREQTTVTTVISFSPSFLPSAGETLGESRVRLLIVALQLLIVALPLPTLQLGSTLVIVLKPIEP